MAVNLRSDHVSTQEPKQQAYKSHTMLDAALSQTVYIPAQGPRLEHTVAHAASAAPGLLLR